MAKIGDESRVRVLAALLSVGDVSLVEEEVVSLGIVQRGYRISVNSSVVLDGVHAESVREFIDKRPA